LQVELAIRSRNVYVTALRPYPSQNIPFAEKTMGKPLHGWTARLLLGEGIADLNMGEMETPERFYVKEAVFPFSRFPGVDPALSPQMRSTGQVLGIDHTFGKAYFKSQIAVNPKMPSQGKVFISARDTEKDAILQVSRKLLGLGFSLISTQGTAQFLAERGIEVGQVHKVSGRRPNIIDLIKNGEIALVINIPGGFQSKRDEEVIRRATIEHNIPLITTTSGALLIVRGIEEIGKSPLTLHPFEV
jgi:carbamoyl-phosphate synthase large subunit